MLKPGVIGMISSILVSLILIERVVTFISCLAVLGILYVEIDDVYGITKLRQMSRRRHRRFWKKFFKDTKKFMKQKFPKQEDYVSQSNERPEY
jgi:hypothetical protein